MNRRDSLKALMLTSGALIALPGWAHDWTRDSMGATLSVFSSNQQDILVSVVDTIIPAGNSIGALSVGVDKFLQKLFADCYDGETQKNVKDQLEKIEQMAITSHGKSFSSCDQKQREQLLLKFSESDVKAEKDFFSLVKSETIRGFTTSREVMMNYLSYKPVPGHYYGCVDVKA
jgi:hypothetical protein